MQIKWELIYENLHSQRVPYIKAMFVNDNSRDIYTQNAAEPQPITGRFLYLDYLL